MTKFAVIGAGLSGLVLARQLQPLADVTVFEKSQGAGGRMATRYAGDFEFDHGAQFFTARSDAFQSFLQPFIDNGSIADWQARFAEFDRSSMTTARAWGDNQPHYVGAPRMNRIGKILSENLNVVFESPIAAIARMNDGWMLSNEAGMQSGPFDWLVMTSPAEQTAALAEEFPELVAYCGDRKMFGCFALMLGFTDPIDLDWQAALVRNAAISWISVNSSKPARKREFTLVVHSTNAWADAHIDDNFDVVQKHLLNEASIVTGKDLNSAAHQQLHRWRFANISKQAGPGYFLDEDARLAACGDWCIHGRVEAAFTSANNLASALTNLI